MPKGNPGILRKRFCPKGHDRLLNGCNTQNHCRLCARERSRWDCIKSEFGLTKEEYIKIFNNQKGLCAMCQMPQTELKMNFCIDHDHLTGNIRGLLCSNCNKSLGHYEKVKVAAEIYLATRAK